jgi:GT2 family glycosyltransferase
MDHLTLSIVIGTYNRLALLQRCLDALDKHVRVNHEIIVVDAGSIDGTLEYLEQCPSIRLVKDEALVGQAKSLNRVFGSLSSDFVCWLSDDNIVVDKALDTAVDILRHNQRIGMVALKLKDVTGPHTYAPYLGAIWESGILNCNQGMLPTELLRQLGGFDEEFSDYGIDADLTTRVLLAGYKVVYTKKIAIYHYRDHETDNWITKHNREYRLQLARELYRTRYARLIIRKKVLSYIPSINSNTSVLSFSLYIQEKLVKHYVIVLNLLIKNYKIMLHLLTYLMDETIVGRRISTFFRDWYNVSHGRFISHWDLFENFCHSYYLVQQIPEPLRMRFQLTENPTLRNG